jgi:hypothetical protein
MVCFQGLLYLLWLALLERPDADMQNIPLTLRVLWFVMPVGITSGSALFVKGILADLKLRNAIDKKADKTQ